MTKAQFKKLEIADATVLVQFALRQGLATVKGRVVRKDRNILVVDSGQEEFPIYPSRILTLHRL